jgi:hypothetical protein
MPHRQQSGFATHYAMSYEPTSTVQRSEISTTIITIPGINYEHTHTASLICDTSSYNLYIGIYVARIALRVIKIALSDPGRGIVVTVSRQNCTQYIIPASLSFGFFHCAALLVDTAIRSFEVRIDFLGTSR